MPSATGVVVGTVKRAHHHERRPPAASSGKRGTGGKQEAAFEHLVRGLVARHQIEWSIAADAPYRSGPPQGASGRGGGDVDPARSAVRGPVESIGCPIAGAGIPETNTKPPTPGRSRPIPSSTTAPADHPGGSQLTAVCPLPRPSTTRRPAPGLVDARAVGMACLRHVAAIMFQQNVVRHR